MSKLVAASIAVTAIGICLLGASSMVLGIPLREMPSVARDLWFQLRLDLVRPEAERHRRRVFAALAGNTEEAWAGTYAWGNGFEHATLDLGPGGVSFEADGCLGTTELAYGEVSGVEGALVRLELEEHLRFEEPAPPGPPGAGRTPFHLSDELYVVPWGAERFLVPRDLMVEFCSLANAGGWHSMRWADYPRKQVAGSPLHNWSVELEGLPEVPAEFERYLPRAVTSR